MTGGIQHGDGQGFNPGFSGDADSAAGDVGGGQ
jgi:hypothetical protein